MRVARDSKLNKGFFGQSVQYFKSAKRFLVSEFRKPRLFPSLLVCQTFRNLNQNIVPIIFFGFSSESECSVSKSCKPETP